MRIMLDTNVLISSIIFKSKIMNELIAAILKDHRLVLSSYVIEVCHSWKSRFSDHLFLRCFDSVDEGIL